MKEDRDLTSNTIDLHALKDNYEQLQNTSKLETEALQKKVELLQLQNELLTSTMHHLPITQIHTNENGAIILLCNSNFLELTGYSEQEIILKSVFDLYHPNSVEDAVLFFKEFQKNKKVKPQEFRLLKKNNTSLYVRLSLQMVSNEGNKPIHTNALWFDITEQRTTEQQLQENIHLLKRAEEVSEIGGWEIDLTQNRKSTWTYGIYSILGLPNNATPPRINEQISWYLPEYRSLVREKVDTFIKTRLPMEYEAQLKTFRGTTIWCKVKAEAILEGDEVTRYRGSFQNITKEKLTEIELLKTKLFLDETEKTSKIGGWTYDTESTDISWTDELYRLHEVSSIFTPTVKSVFRLYPSKSKKKIKQVIKNVLNDGKSLEFELEFKTAKGKNKWANIVAKPLVKNRKIVALSGSFQDITLRKKAEIAVLDAERQNRVILETATDGFWKLDKDGYLTNVNDSYCKMSGYASEELLLMHLSDLDATKNKQRSTTILEELTKEGKSTVEMRHQRKDGSLFDVEINMQYSNQLQGYFVAFIHDITKRKSTEEHLRQYEHIVSSSTDMMALVDLDYRYLCANKAFYDMLQLSPDQLLNKTILEVFGSTFFEEKIKPYALECITGKDVKFQDWFQVSDQKGLFMEVNYYPYLNKNKEVIGFAVNRRDITFRINAEKELIEAKEQAESSDRLKSAFLANMSHEIRTPMNGILGFTSLLKNNNLERQKQNSYLTIIEESGARMLNIINDLIDISRVEAGQVEVTISSTNVNDQLQYLHSFFNPEVEGKGMTLDYSMGLKSPQSIIKTDREKLYAILINLIKNAIKYSNHGDIKFGYELTQNHELEFFVQDQGIGIEEDQQVTIFDRFVQADMADRRAIQGAGLGLSIAKAFVDMLGGKLRVESKKDVGSTFYFTHPYVVPTSKPIEDNLQINLPYDTYEIKKKLKIMIAEDDMPSAKYLSLLMQPFAKYILKAHTGDEAIQLAKENTDIDLILMDVKMPYTNGYTATKQIRNFNKEVIIIAQTAFSLPDYQKKAIDSGCNDCITKPIDPEKLYQLISNHFS